MAMTSEHKMYSIVGSFVAIGIAAFFCCMVIFDLPSTEHSLKAQAENKRQIMLTRLLENGKITQEQFVDLFNKEGSENPVEAKNEKQEY